MRVLVTGSEGLIGRALTAMLREAGMDVRTFDRAAAGSHRTDDFDHRAADLLDAEAVREALRGVDAVTHLGAIADDWEGHDHEVLDVNVRGTWNVLLGCAEEGIDRVVYFSSVQALGNFCGYRKAEYLPIDDATPRHPMSAYQLSKHLGEEACSSFTEQTGMKTICIRPVGVMTDPHLARWQRSQRPHDPQSSRTEYWTYVHINDVCRAAMAALSTPNVTHDAFLVAAEDNLSAIPTAELVDRIYPDTPWPKVSRGEYLAANSFRSLVDCSHAREVLGWQPVHSWRPQST
jgi:UDP-glucose 4-epimerase